MMITISHRQVATAGMRMQKGGESRGVIRTISHGFEEKSTATIRVCVVYARGQAT